MSAAPQTGFLKDVIHGGIDGAVTTFAIVAGVAGAGLSPSIIVALGLANIIAIEESHIADHRDGELEELRQILGQRGLSGAVLVGATAEVSLQKDKWIGLMLTDEYGLTRDAPLPLKAAIATFVAFLLAGSVPLIPFLLALPSAFETSVVATLLTFFLIGSGKSRWSLSSWWRSGLETLTIGATAALLACGVGGLFHAS